MSARRTEKSIPFVSRLLNSLEAAPGWSKLGLVLDALYTYYHRRTNGFEEATSTLANKFTHCSGLVIVVCKGNICRSSFLGRYLNRMKTDKTISFQSAGLRINSTGIPPQHAIDAARDFGIDLSVHRARPLRYEDVKSADLIVGMEPIHHLEFCLRYFKWRRKFLLLRTLERTPDSLKLYDPFGQDMSSFQECYRMLAQDGEILLSTIQGLTRKNVN